MDYSRYRKHPRVYSKKPEEKGEKTMVLNAVTAAGILAFTFINGIGLGYLIRKKLR